MYVALRETFDVAPDGSASKVFPGQEVKSFLTWPARNQMAALSARIVREVPDGAEIRDEEIYVRQDASQIREAKARVLAADIAAMPTEPALVSKPKIPFEEIEQVPQPEAHLCTDCAFSSPSARGLAIHRGRDHKGA